MSDLALHMRTDSLLDYVAELRERQEELEEIIGSLAERVAALEEQALVLGGGRKSD
jgi:hypothetical protein